MPERDSRGEVEALFPRLAGSAFRVTSPFDGTYNCVAYVAGDRNRWWEPGAIRGFYWPPELPPKDESLENYLRCFEQLGFQRCIDGALEDGVEKIAVFVDDDDDFSHVARQLADGWWTSKLGAYEDISHPTPEHLLAGRPTPYGNRLIFLCRARIDAGPGRSGFIVPD